MMTNLRRSRGVQTYSGGAAIVSGGSGETGI